MVTQESFSVCHSQHSSSVFYLKSFSEASPSAVSYSMERAENLAKEKVMQHLPTEESSTWILFTLLGPQKEVWETLPIEHFGNRTN